MGPSWEARWNYWADLTWVLFLRVSGRELTRCNLVLPTAGPCATDAIRARPGASAPLWLFMWPPCSWIECWILIFSLSYFRTSTAASGLIRCLKLLFPVAWLLWFDTTTAVWAWLLPCPTPFHLPPLLASSLVMQEGGKFPEKLLTFCPCGSQRSLSPGAPSVREPALLTTALHVPEWRWSVLCPHYWVLISPLDLKTCRDIERGFHMRQLWPLLPAMLIFWELRVLLKVCSGVVFAVQASLFVDGAAYLGQFLFLRWRRFQPHLCPYGHVHQELFFLVTSVRACATLSPACPQQAVTVSIKTNALNSE